MFPGKEIELFKLKLQVEKENECECTPVKKPNDGKYLNQSDHVQVKEVQAKLDVKYRETVIAEAINKVRTAQLSGSQQKSIV